MSSPFHAVRAITTSPPMDACQVTITFTAINEIDISAAKSAANPYFDVYVSLPQIILPELCFKSRQGYDCSLPYALSIFITTHT